MVIPLRADAGHNGLLDTRCRCQRLARSLSFPVGYYFTQMQASGEALESRWRELVARGDGRGAPEGQLEGHLEGPLEEPLEGPLEGPLERPLKLLANHGLCSAPLAAPLHFERGI